MQHFWRLLNIFYKKHLEKLIEILFMVDTALPIAKLLLNASINLKQNRPAKTTGINKYLEKKEVLSKFGFFF